MQVKREIITTGDGSKTIYFPDLNENYHSTHGALQEAMHVFIRNGLNAFQERAELIIYEVGLGTCLNAILTYEASQVSNQKIQYNGIEAFPIMIAEQNALDYEALLKNEDSIATYREMYQQSFGKSVRYNGNFLLNKIHAELANVEFTAMSVDLIYFDAFGPRVQEEMWTQAIFGKLYAALKPQGMLVTYCAKGQVKRDLKAVGFEIECVPGPPGKREMTRAWKR